MSGELVQAAIARHSVLVAQRRLTRATRFDLQGGDSVTLFDSGTVTLRGGPVVDLIRRQLHDAGVMLGKRDRAIIDQAQAAPILTEATQGSVMLELQVDGLLGLSVEGKAQLREVMAEFADLVAREASLLEEGERRGASAPEITGPHVRDAYQVVRRPRFAEPPPKPRGFRAAQVIQVLSVMLTGAMLTLLHSAWQDSLCTGAGVVAVSTSIYVLAAT